MNKSEELCKIIIIFMLYSLGYFKTLDEAIKVQQQAQQTEFEY